MDLDRLFHNILKPTLGCTEPVAIALAVGTAVQATAGWYPGRDKLPLAEMEPASVRNVRLQVNKNVFKNCFSIYIPNTQGHKGIQMAAALGIFCDPRRQLEVFADITAEHTRQAQVLIDEGRILVEVVSAPYTDLFIEAAVIRAAGETETTGICRIQDQHTKVCLVRQDQRELFRAPGVSDSVQEPDPDQKKLMGLSIGEMLDLVTDLPESVRDLIRRTIAMNRKASEAGLNEPMGLGTGYYETVEGGDLITYLASVAAAGSDARMSGFTVEVMSSAGSGNQGIIATMPIVAYADRAGLSEDVLIRAVALSHLITMYITLYVGYLSALCGVAIKAGIGAACGVAYAMGGRREEIGRAVKIMAATLSGMVCDGAKPGCALKVGSSADMAVRAASLAMKKMDVSDDNGIVAKTAEETIRNLAELSHSMDVVDQKIIQIMNEKIRR
jgi:L-cysteine desulfidase